MPAVKSHHFFAAMPIYSTAQFRQYVVDLLQQATGLTIQIPTILSTADYRGLVVDLLTVLAQGGGGSGNATQLQGRNVSATLPLANQLLAWNATTSVWEPKTVSGTGTVTSVTLSAGTTGLTVTNPTVTSSGTITLAGTLNVASGGTGATTLTGYVKGSGTSAFTASATVPAADVSGALAASNLPALTGDVSSTAGTASVTVTKLQGNAVVSGVPSSGQVLKWNGTAWAASSDTDTGITALTGDVTASGSGSVTATVAKIQGRTVASAIPAAGQALIWNGSTLQWEPTSITAGGGIVTSVTAGTGLNGGTITSSGTISVNFGTATGTVTQGGTTVLKSGDTMTGSLTIGTNGTGSSLTVSNAVSATSDCVTITNLGSGYSLRVNSESGDITPFVIANNGNVGIGAPNPTYKLTVDGSASIATIFDVFGEATFNARARFATSIQFSDLTEQVTAAVTSLTGDVTTLGSGASAATVARIQGRAVSATAPTSGQVLAWNGTAWTPTAAGGGGTVTSVIAGTGLTGGTITSSGTIAVNFGTTNGTVTQGGTTVLKAGDSMSGALTIATNINSAALSITQSGNGDALVVGSNLMSISKDGHIGIGLTPNPSYALRVDTGGIFTQGSLTFGDNSTQSTAGITSLTGDVTTSGAGASAATVARIQGRAVSATAPTSGQDLEWSGTAWTPSNKLKFSSTKVVGVDAATIQGCIDLVTSASWNNQTQILIPAGIYTENLTLKPCVSLASVGGNNGQGSVVRIVGTHTATGSSTAGDSVLELNGIRFDNSTTTATLTFSANGTVPFLVHMQDCMVGNSNSSTAVSGVVVNNYVSIRAVNIRSLANSTAGSGGTHWDLNGGSLYAQGCSTEYGTRALLMRGTNGSFYPYAELKASYFSASGADLISITSATALLTAGWCSFENKATTGNGINIAAGSTAGVYKSAFIITSGASNYVVTGAAGCAYFSTGNSYSNSSAVPYETKIGASVAQYAYTSTDVSKSGDTMSGKLTLTNNGTTAPLNLGAQANVGTLTGGDLWINSSGVLSWRTTAGATITAVTTSALTSFVAGVGAAIGSSTTPALVVQQNGTNAAMTVTNVSSSNTDCVTITNLGSGNSLVVNDETTPDSTRFAISASGRVGIGVAPDATAALAVDSSGIKFSDGNTLTTIVTSADLSGTLPSPTVVRLQGRAVAGTLPTSGQVLAWNSVNAQWQPTTLGSSSGTVTSVDASGGATGLTFSGGPITGSGTLTLAGTLAVANGGTGQTTYSNGQLLIGNAAGGLSKATLTAGSNITITNGNGTITIASTGGGSGITALTGDVTASGTGSVSASVVKIQGNAVSSTAPANGQVLQWNSTLSQWTPSGASSGALQMVVYTNVGVSTGIVMPAGYKWADIYISSGAGGGGGGMDSMNGYNGGAGYGGGGGCAGLSEFLSKIPVDNASFEFEIGAGGVGGVGHSTYTGQTNTNGGNGMPSYLKITRNGVTRILSDLGKWALPSALGTSGGFGGNNGGSGGSFNLPTPSAWSSTLTNGGMSGYGQGSSSTFTLQNNVGKPITVGGSGGGGVSSSPADGGPVSNAKFPNLDPNNPSILRALQGIASSGQQDATAQTIVANNNDVDFDSLNFLGGAGGAAGDITLNIPLMVGYRAGNGADGNFGCGGGGGGAIGGPTSDTFTPYYGGDGGDGGQGFVIFICYN